MFSTSGLRRGEIFNLKWFDIDLARGVLHVRQSKSGRARTVPINTTSRKLLESLPKVSEYAFASPQTGGRIVDVGRQFEKAVKIAGLEDFRFHDLRHTAATRMAEAGADAFTLCAIFGWTDIRMALRYTHATNAATRRAVENLDAPLKVGNELATEMKTASMR